MNKVEHNNYNCKLIYDTGEEKYVYSNWLNNNNLNNFEGWECFTGTTRIFIDKSLDVYNGMCYTKHLGNLKTNWNLLEEKIICPNKKCTSNTDDLATKRNKL